jgi:mRNA-degrading endonuclease toxin of MazEF toxin-antitoxin module
MRHRSALSAALTVLCAEAAAAGPLDYRPAPFAWQAVEVSASAGSREFEVRFPSPVVSPFPANDTVWAHLILPLQAGGRRAPCIVVLPVMAAPNTWIEDHFIRTFAAEGFAVLWIEMPYQFHRRPRVDIPSGQVFLSRTAAGLARNFRQSALDTRRAIDWLAHRPDIDPRRIGLFGVSLGGMVGAAVYSVDPVPEYAVFLLAGADFPSLVQASVMTGAFARRMGISSDQMRLAWQGLDPWGYREANAARPALLVNVRWDAVVPRANALKLHEAFPASRQQWLLGGHYSAILHLLWMPRYVARDFLRHL